MEKAEVEKCSSGEEAHLSRNRSFKSKQLVRSQAIREAASPPRTASPYSKPEDPSEASSNLGDDGGDDRKQPVQIQITSGGWENDSYTDQRLRTKRWLGQRPHSDSSRDLLSYNPRVTCVCGQCACPNCRGKRRHICAVKQDSGIVCSVDCPDCDNIGTNGKAANEEADDQSFYCRCPERRERPKNISGNDADDKTELSDTDLVNFIKDTLNKNPKDRITLLKIEKELHSLVNDSGRCIVRFPVMTSYGRMLVHRCAGLFQLAHHIDHSNKTCVVVSKNGTSGGRIPCTSFKQWCSRVFPRSPPRAHDDTLAKSILKRAGGSSEDGAGSGSDVTRSKSLEQREKDYERVRRRIFSTDNCTQDEGQWPWMGSGPVKLLTPELGRNKLVKVQSLETRGDGATRGVVSKSHSFGGYTAEPSQPRVLSRQGDLASSSWRLSPSSSGYKTLSLRSTDSITPSPTGGASPEPGSEAATLVWAVTDIAAVPPGAIVIHPQTGRPLTNPDGSLYHFDPANPPAIYTPENEKTEINEKRRGKLEKQHSFIDAESDCASEECRKCCCDCSGNGSCEKCASEKMSPQESKVSSIPNSPSKEPKTKEEITPQPIEPIETKDNISVYEVEPHIAENIETKFEREEVDNKQFEQKFEIQKQYEPKPANQTPQLEPANQQYYKPANQRVFDSYRANKIAENQAVIYPSQEMVYQNYGQEMIYGNDELQQQQAMAAYNSEMAELQTMMSHAKITPQPDPNIRPMSINNMMYPNMATPYQYVSPCRIDQNMQATLYQPMLEEHKHLAAQQADNTFRIDPSYPYPTEFNAYGGCPEPLIQQRGYNMAYGQVEAAMMPTYQVPNVIIQPHLQHYPYQEGVQWQPIQVGSAASKLMLQDVYPRVCHGVYQPYNVVYPPVIPQPYPICQPVYPITEKPPDPRRNTATPRKRSLPNSSRNTPQIAPTSSSNSAPVQKEDSEISAKIQQIKEQIESGNKEREKREGELRRNSGSGILGSYPVNNNFNGRVSGPTHEESQLSSAARAIVNSIRNIQAKNNSYNDSRKFTENRIERPEYRRPYRDDKDRSEYRAQRTDRSERDRNRGVFRDPFPVQYRPPYLLRQMTPGTWCRRSPGPVHPVLNPPRRPYPDTRTPRR
ncbi:uncharacterized protein LOC126968294 isoform X2 [Leptidea sinapis]|uniref:uncharacterized protein LOC126968294 isoform X2 n=1 Tax=Leptidea sinapis TaxID=189913 RepID=UPI00213E3A72|nr:uncharacterized protein LOC126968294 isoform X2 [Leptidea sinapis]